METTNPLKNIYYISIPESFNDSIGSFSIDKAVKLPIETDGLDKWNPDSLTWEKIISAMLKIMAYDSQNINLEYYREFIKSVRPNILEELTDSAIVKSHNKDFTLAKEIFLAIVGLEPNNDRNLLNLAVLYESEADWCKKDDKIKEESSLLEKTNEIYTQLLEEENILNDTYFNAGFFFLKVRDFDKAKTCLDSFIVYSDDETKIKEAKKILSEFTNLSGNETIFNNAYNSILQENESDAIQIMLDFLDNNPQIWNAWFLLGWAYRRISNFTEAKEALYKALEINKEDSDIYNELAICLLELGDFKQCQKILEEALRLSPEDVKIISNLGIIQLKIGNNLEAKRYFNTALVYDPEDKISLNYLEQLK